jgi:hypothetical protein
LEADRVGVASTQTGTTSPPLAAFPPQGEK